jgi:iron complex outermembrane recepter protein
LINIKAEYIMTLRKKPLGSKPTLLCSAIAGSVLTTFITPPAVANDGFSLEEIVVTARKREESLQDTPISVSAVSGQLLNEMGIADLTGIADVAPNVSFSTTGTVSGSTSSAVVYIRGIGQNDYVPVVDPGVGIYVDDVYMGRSVGSVLDLMDVKRIEVVRGPQGTLFGRNSIGGAISLTTNSPTEEFGGKFRVIGGDDNRAEFFATLNVPFSDTLRANLNLMSRKRDGTVERILVPGSEKLGNDNSKGARIKVDWDASERLMFELAADYVREREESAPEVNLFIRDDALLPASWNGYGAASALAVTSTASGCVQGNINVGTDCYNNSLNEGPFKTRETSLSQNDVDSWGLSLASTYEMSDDVTAKLILAYRDLEAYFARQVDGTPLNIFENRDEYLHEQVSADFRLNGSSESLDWVTGLFYYKEEADNQLDFTGALEGAAYPIHFGGLVENENYAVYGEGTYHLTDQLHLTAGLRYTDETKRASPNAYRYPTGDIENPPPPGAPGTSELFPDDWNENSFSELTYRLVVAYDFSDDTTTYASVSTGFKSGGFEWRITNTNFRDDLSLNGKLPSFDPETVTSYEIGLKTELPDAGLRMNASLFHSDYQDMIVAANAGGIATFQTNAAQATIDGIEVEITWIPVNALLINLNLGYIDASYEKLTPGAIAAGLSIDDEFVNTPKNTASWGASYMFTLADGASLTPRVDGSYKSKQHFEANNSDYVFDDGHTAWNASLRYSSPEELWSVSAGVENLTDELYLVGGDANSAIGYENGIYARPRNYYVNVEYEF